MNDEFHTEDWTTYLTTVHHNQLGSVLVDYESVNEYVMFLWQKAQEFNGNYDGWETFIVND
ncbi:MAG: ribonuclease E inhibitor RraB [Pyrinomonadaceae bacterium]|nr:ribonuclease E inhibitor RraB [Pyrinomonadaceae bacterium]